MRVEINNLTDQALNEDVHELIMGYTTDPAQIVPSLQLWVGEIPDYINSLDEALAVIDKIRQTGGIFSIVNTLEGEWNASILELSATENSWQPIVTVCNGSLPRAICEAALQAAQMQRL